MTHDPLCEWRPCTCPLDYDVPERGHMIGCPEDDCECEIIAKVRADQSMVDYAKHLVLDYERTGESWEAGYKMGREHERETCVKIVQSVGVGHQYNAGRNVWRNEALVKLGYTGHI